MTLFNLPFQEKRFLKESTLFCICHEMFLFLCVPCQILLRQCPETFFRRPKLFFLRPKGVFTVSVRAGRVRMKIHSAPFFESSSLKMRFSSKTRQKYWTRNKNAERKGLWRLKVESEMTRV